MDRAVCSQKDIVKCIKQLNSAACNIFNTGRIMENAQLKFVAMELERIAKNLVQKRRTNLIQEKRKHTPFTYLWSWWWYPYVPCGRQSICLRQGVFAHDFEIDAVIDAFESFVYPPLENEHYFTVLKLEAEYVGADAPAPWYRIHTLEWPSQFDWQEGAIPSIGEAPLKHATPLSASEALYFNQEEKNDHAFLLVVSADAPTHYKEIETVD